MRGFELEFVDPRTAELEVIEGDEVYCRLWFDFRYITDELVFYAMRAQVVRVLSKMRGE